MTDREREADRNTEIVTERERDTEREREREWASELKGGQGMNVESELESMDQAVFIYLIYLPVRFYCLPELFSE